MRRSVVVAVFVMAILGALVTNGVAQDGRKFLIAGGVGYASLSDLTNEKINGVTRNSENPTPDGSLAIGGLIGIVACAAKQEVLLALVGGVFVVEAGSVILQVTSYKLRKKRVFLMAPLHHHFQKLGWTDEKIVTRFWIMSIIFALSSVATLKIR